MSQLCKISVLVTVIESPAWIIANLSSPLSVESQLVLLTWTGQTNDESPEIENVALCPVIKGVCTSTLRQSPEISNGVSGHSIWLILIQYGITL